MVGLYRDDGLACFENVSGPQAEKIRKDVFKIFKQEFDLNITRKTNLKIVNFLDVTLNLSMGKYQPCNKLDNDPLYIDINYNHPRNITKNLLHSISNQRKSLFNGTKDLYNNTLKTNGYKQNIKFQHNVFLEAQKRKSNRVYKVIWFNPPYSCSVATDIDQKLFLLLNKHFPKAHKFYKVFSRNSIKVSYSSMPNISSITKSHNKKVLSNDESKSPKSSCNCKVFLSS